MSQHEDSCCARCRCARPDPGESLSLTSTITYQDLYPLKVGKPVVDKACPYFCKGACVFGPKRLEIAASGVTEACIASRNML